METAEFLGLDGFDVVDTKDEIINEKEYKILTLKSNQHRPSCPYCGSHNCYSNGTRNKDVRDLDIVGKHVKLRIKTRQYKCNDCSRLFTEKHNIIDGKSCATIRFDNEVGFTALNSTFENVAERFDLSKTEVKSCFDKWLASQDHNRLETIYAPEILGIDEAHLCPEGNGSEASMRGVFVDIKNARLIDITRNRKKETVIDWLSHMKETEKLKVVTIDMWRGYRDAVYETFGDKVKVVIDHYHVIQELERRMMECRNKLTEDAPAGTFRGFTDYQSLMKTNFEDLADTMKTKLARLFEVVPELKICYGLKESFRSIYNCQTRTEAEQAFERWRNQIPSDHRYRPYVELGNMVDRWNTEIFNFFDCERYTNATTESLNAIIKKVNRSGNGYSFDVLRAKLLYGAGRSAEVRAIILKASKLEEDIDDLTTISFTSTILDRMTNKYDRFSTYKALYKYLSNVSLNELNRCIDEGLLNNGPREYL